MNDAFKDDKPTVLVMMASYNGEKFIDEQIDSILAQKDVHVTLRICDDGSNDSTPSICESYASKYDNVLFEVNKVNKGLAKNFMDMVYDDNALGFNYYAFSDQDDVWLPEKLIHAIVRLKRRFMTSLRFTIRILRMSIVTLAVAQGSTLPGLDAANG